MRSKQQGLQQRKTSKGEVCAQEGPLAMSPELTVVWFVIGLIVAALIGIAAGFLSWLERRSVPAAILVGGAAFAGAAALLLGLWQAFE